MSKPPTDDIAAMPTSNATSKAKPQPTAEVMILGKFALFNDGGRLNRMDYYVYFHGVMLLLMAFVALDKTLVTPRLSNWLEPDAWLLSAWRLMYLMLGLRLFLLCALFIMPGEARANARGEQPPPFL